MVPRWRWKFFIDWMQSYKRRKLGSLGQWHIQMSSKNAQGRDEVIYIHSQGHFSLSTNNLKGPTCSQG